jgi:hypothetical protein
MNPKGQLLVTAGLLILGLLLLLTCSHKGSEPLKNVTDLTAPVIDSLSATAAAIGQNLIVYGKRFGATQDSTSAVLVGSKPLTVASWSDTLIDASIPDSVETSKLYVKVGDKRSNKLVFTVITEPVITRVDPARGTYGTGVTIYGFCLGEQRGEANALFGDKEGYIYVRSDTSIHTKYPQGCESDSVSVVIYNLRSNALPYRVHGIESVSPSTIVPGDTVVVHGTGFGTAQGTSIVTLNGAILPVVSWSDDSIEVSIMSSSRTGPLSVTVENLASNEMRCTVLRTPTLISIEPDTGTYGTNVVLRGYGLQPPRGHPYIYFGGVYAYATTYNDSIIETKYPTGCATGVVSVLVDDVTSNSIPYTAFGITKVEPTETRPGDTITITGNGFGAAQGTGSVTLGGVPMTVVQWRDKYIKALVSEDHRSGEVAVRMMGIGSNTVGITVGFVPVLTSIEPSFGTYGTRVTLRGKNFAKGRWKPSVRFSGVYAPRHSYTDEIIETSIPSGISSGYAKVILDDIASDSLPFSVFGLKKLDPIATHVGDTVTIIGTGFGVAQGMNYVLFGGLTVPSISWSDERILFEVPEGATTGDVQVLISDVASNSINLPVGLSGGLYDLLYRTDHLEVSFSGVIDFISNQYQKVVFSAGTFDTFFWDSATFYTEAEGEGPSWWGMQHTETSILGNLNAEATAVDSLAATWQSWYIGSMGDNTEEYRYYAMKLTALPLSKASESDTTVTFEVVGPEVQQHVASIYLSCYRSTWDDQGYPQGEESYHYTDTDWNNTEHPPKLTVTFRKN